MRAAWCSSVLLLLLGLAVCQAVASPGAIEKKSLAEDAKSGLKIGAAGAEKDRAKKSAAFCVEIRPGADVSQTSRNCREKKSNNAQNGQQSPVRMDNGAASQLAQTSQASESGQESVHAVNLPASQSAIDQMNQQLPGQVQQPGTPCGGLTKIPSMPGIPYSPEQPNPDETQLLPIDVATAAVSPSGIPTVSMPGENLPVRDPVVIVDPPVLTDNRGYEDVVPSISAMFEERLKKCIGDVVRDIYQPSDPIPLEPNVLIKPLVPMALRNSPNALFNTRGSGYVPQTARGSIAPVMRSDGSGVNSRIVPGSMVQNPQRPYQTGQVRQAPIAMVARPFYRQVPVNTARETIVTLEQPGFQYAPQYSLANELYQVPGMIERIRYLRSSKDGSAEEGQEEESKEKKESS